MSNAEYDTLFVAHNLVLRTHSTAMALHAMFKLGIPDILAGADGRKPMLAEEILQKLPTKGTPGSTSVTHLQRLLVHLVREGVFSESVNGDAQPVYGLTEISEWYIRGSQLSVAAYADLMFSPETLSCYATLHEAILDETTHPFLKVHGLHVYEYNQRNSTYELLFNKVMEATGTRFLSISLERFLENLGLDGVNTLVDVGGCRGTMIAQVIARHPHVKGINFDRPYIIAQAPAINGVQHVAGNFFDSVPSGDAMFLKWVIHNYGDEQAIQILKNCAKALPAKTGRVILAEYIIDKNDEGPVGRYTEHMDLIMQIFLPGARERSQAEYEKLLLAAGFSRFKITPIGGAMNLIEGFKE